LEQQILKLNYRSFTQVVILGSSTFIPFMQLKARHRREVVEEILDIQIIYYAFLRRIAKEKKQTHVKNKIIQNVNYESWTTMEGDNSQYVVMGFDPTVMLPDEDVYKPKKKLLEKTKGLESFMEEDEKKDNKKRNKKV